MNNPPVHASLFSGTNVRDIQSNPRNNKMNYYVKFSTSPVRYRIGEEDNKW